MSGVTDTLVMAREQFPGKSNSLDALCKRLEVDNTNRTLHGALLDAGLLAEVYIRLTRGQDSLVMELTEETTGGPGEAGGRSTSRASCCRVLAANEKELAAHARRCWARSTRRAAARRSGVALKKLWHNPWLS